MTLEPVQDDLAAGLRHALDPVAFARERCAWQPDPWQERVLSSPSRRILLNMTRQAGKSTTTALIALHTAMYRPGGLILLFSRGDRQSGELLLKIQEFIGAMTQPPTLTKESATEIRLANKSRIVSLPGNADSIRGYSAPVLIIEDEAGFVDDALTEAYLPMLATSNGRLILMSTPNGKRGHFHALWTSMDPRWHRERITASECPRISAEYLADMRSHYGPWKYKQEFECAFVEANDQFFSDIAIERAFSGDVPLLQLVF